MEEIGSVTMISAKNLVGTIAVLRSVRRPGYVFKCMGILHAGFLLTTCIVLVTAYSGSKLLTQTFCLLFLVLKNFLFEIWC